MADPNFQYTPANGWNDSNTFPTNPNKNAVRGLFQLLFDQVRDFINNSLIPWTNSKFATISALQSVVLGQIPDGTITDAKLAPTGHISDYTKHGITGITDVAGTNTAYTLTPNPGLSAYSIGLKITLFFDKSNGGALTLNVSGKGAIPWRKQDGSDYSAGEIAINTPYTGVYNGISFLADSSGGLCEFFGDGSDGALNTAGDVNLVSTQDGAPVIKQYTSITINAGHTLSVQNRCEGLILLCRGDVVINGVINMNAKAPFNPINRIVVPLKQELGTKANVLKPLSSLINVIGALPAGGVGGNGGAGGNALLSGGAGGAVFIATSDSPYYCGGGPGAGGGGGGSGDSSSPGYGAYGGLGGNIGIQKTGASGGGSSSSSYGSVGGAGSKGSGAGGGYDYNRSGGSGGVTTTTPGGAGGGAGGIANRGNGGNGNAAVGTGGGLIVIIAKGNVTINVGGSIQANGGAGGAGGNTDSQATSDVYAAAGGGGGGTGGGIVGIFYAGNYTNSGSISVNGGVGGAGGVNSNYTGSPTLKPGGAGTSGNVGSVKTQQVTL